MVTVRSGEIHDLREGDSLRVVKLVAGPGGWGLGRGFGGGGVEIPRKGDTCGILRVGRILALECARVLS